MNTFKSRFAASVLTGFACLASATLVISAQAQTNPYANWHHKKAAPHPAPAHSRAYVPTRGSSTRQGIADAMRRDVGKFAGVYVVFTYSYIKANGNWAYAEAQPSSTNGKSQYEPVTALLKRSGSSWKVIDRVAGEGDTDPVVALRQLKSRNTNAPRDIFPR